MKETLHYFAYGSNMCVARLRERVPSARFVNQGYLVGHVLRFHKRGVDGSAKCNALRTGRQDDWVHGAIFNIDSKHKPMLDTAESLGAGYVISEKKISTMDGYRKCFFYVAQAAYINEELKPFDWYRQYVLEGALLHGLPGPYVRYIEQVAIQPDPDKARQEHNLRTLKAPA